MEIKEKLWVFFIGCLIIFAPLLIWFFGLGG